MLCDVISSILFSIIDVNRLIQLLGTYNLLNPPGAIKNGQSRETDNIGYTRRTIKTHNAICAEHHYTRTNTNNINQT